MQLKNAINHRTSFFLSMVFILAAIHLLIMACATQPEAKSWDECLPSFVSGMSEKQVSIAEYGAGDVVLVKPDENKDRPFALIVTDNRVPVLGIRVNFFSDDNIFKIEAAIDGSCRPVKRWEVLHRPGEKTLQNWDTVIFRSGGIDYGIRLGLHGSGRIEADLRKPE